MELFCNKKGEEDKVSESLPSEITFIGFIFDVRDGLMIRGTDNKWLVVKMLQVKI